MALSDELCKILATGIEKERAAHDFYLEAAERTQNPLGEKMLRGLAEEEAKHETLLATWSDEGSCPADSGSEVLDKDFIRKGREKIAESVQPDAGDMEALELGRQMERQAIAFYQSAADEVSDAETKDLLLKLKAEEDKHLALLTDLQEYMKDPNLWSVREGGAHFDA